MVWEQPPWVFEQRVLAALRPPPDMSWLTMEEVRPQRVLVRRGHVVHP